MINWSFFTSAGSFTSVLFTWRSGNFWHHNAVLSTFWGWFEWAITAKKYHSEVSQRLFFQSLNIKKSNGAECSVFSVKNKHSVDVKAWTLKKVKTLGVLHLISPFDLPSSDFPFFDLLVSASDRRDVDNYGHRGTFLLWIYLIFKWQSQQLKLEVKLLSFTM